MFRLQSSAFLYKHIFSKFLNNSFQEEKEFAYLGQHDPSDESKTFVRITDN
jgi:hypothetical protein